VDNMEAVDPNGFQVFANSQIEVVNGVGGSYYFGSSKAEELSDNTKAKAKAVVWKQVKSYYARSSAIDIWLCGEELADSVPYGFTDTTDYVKFTWNTNMETLYVTVSGDYTFRLEDSNGHHVALSENLIYGPYGEGEQKYLDLSVLDLKAGATYYVNMSVAGNQHAAGEIWMESGNGYWYDYDEYANSHTYTTSRELTDPEWEDSSKWYVSGYDKGVIDFSYTYDGQRVLFTGGRYMQADSITLGEGNDLIQLEPSNIEGLVEVGWIDTGDGHDTLLCGCDTVLICGDINFGDGNDTFQLLPDGDFANTMNRNNPYETLMLDFGDGDDTLQIGRSVDFEVYGNGHQLNFGDGNDKMHIEEESRIKWTCTGNAGDSVIDFGAGDDVLDIDEGAALSAHELDFGSGNDTLVLNGLLQINRSNQSEDILSGLENVSGYGQLWIAGGLDGISQGTLDKFTAAGITVVDRGQDYEDFKGWIA